MFFVKYLCSFCSKHALLNLDSKESFESGRASRVIYCPRLFILFFQNNIKLTEIIMIFVYFNTVLDGYCQEELGSSNYFDFFFYRKKIVSGEVLLTRRAAAACGTFLLALATQHTFLMYQGL